MTGSIGQVAVHELDSKPRREKLRHRAGVENAAEDSAYAGHSAPRKPFARAAGVRLRAFRALRPLGGARLCRADTQKEDAG